MAPAVDAMDHVMDLETSRRTATRHAAAASVATPYQASSARRNILMRTLGHRAVDRPDMLSVAHRTIDRRGLDRDLRAGPVLPALPAAPTDGHRDLVLRPTGSLRGHRTIENRAAQRLHERVVGQVRSVLAIEHRPRLAQQGERLGRELEPDDMRSRLGIRRIVGPVAGPMVGDEL